MKKQLTNFTYTYCRFHFKVLSPLELPAFIGGIIRGKFGSTLKNNQHCIDKTVGCQECMYKQYCTYFRIFENEASDNSPDHGKYLKQPRPYIFKAPMEYKSYYSPNQALYIDLVLLGSGINFLNDIITALKSMGNNKGNNNGLNLELDRIEYQQGRENEGPVFGKQLNILNAADIPMNNTISKLEMKFLSPLRILEKGNEITDITLELLLKRTLLRIELLNTIFCKGSPLSAQIELPRLKITSELYRYEQKRVSHRNHQLTDMGGLLGSITIEGDLKDVYPVLKLGELLHVGKYASFGMGQFEVVEL